MGVFNRDPKFVALVFSSLPIHTSRPSGERINTPVSATVCLNFLFLEILFLLLLFFFFYRVVFVSSILNAVVEEWTGSARHEQTHDTVWNASLVAQ